MTDQENWKEAHDKACEYITALEEQKNYLRDEAIRIAKERDSWMAAYREAMRPVVVY